MKHITHNKTIGIIFLTLFGLLLLSLPVHAEEIVTTTPDIIETSTTTLNIEETTVEEITPTTTPTEESGVTNRVIVTYLDTTIFDDIIFTSSTYFTDNSGTDFYSETVTALGVLSEAARQGNFEVTTQNLGWGYYVSDISGYVPTGFDGWIYNVNQEDPGWTGIADYIISDGDLLTVFYSVWPWKIESTTVTTTIDSAVHFTAYTYSSSTWNSAPSTTISINDELFTTDSSGQYIYTPTTTGTISAFIFGTPDWPQNSSAITIEVLDTKSSTTTSQTDSTQYTNGIGSSSETTNSQVFDVPKAIQFLSEHESYFLSDSSALYTDWSAIAFGAYDKQHETAKKITQYLLTDPDPTAGLNIVSDYARRAMALMSLNINPYSGTKSNYIDKIIKSHDGTQFGDVNLYNDDIFALIPLLHAGYTAQDNIIQSTVKFILNNQVNGGWHSVDLTAAAIQALSSLTEIEGVTQAILDAKEKLKNTQNSNGSWDNTAATAWAMQAISSLNEDESDWHKNNSSPADYLYTMQSHTDGGVGVNTNLNTRVWNTAYAIPAALGKDWHDILHDFTRPSIQTPDNQPYTPILDPSIKTPTSTVLLQETTTSTAVHEEQNIPTSTIPMITSTTLVEIEINTDDTNTKIPEENSRPQHTTQVVQGTRIEANELPNTTLAGSSDTTPITIPETTQIQPQTIEQNKSIKNIPLYISLGGAITIGLYLIWKFVRSMI